jgi:hypothetical protein
MKILEKKTTLCGRQVHRGALHLDDAWRHLQLLIRSGFGRLVGVGIGVRCFCHGRLLVQLFLHGAVSPDD